MANDINTTPDYIPSALTLSSRHATVGTLFHNRVAVNPNHLAVVDGPRKLTYTALEERSNRLANGLLNLGIKRGDRVGILAHNCQEYIELELAAAKAGFIVAALNCRLGTRELTHCINLVAPKIIIVQASTVANLQALGKQAYPQILIGSEYEELLRVSSNEYPNLDIDPESGLIILYTSGTTGMPKGALISHRAFIARAMCFASEMQIPINDNYCAWPPMYHMASTDQLLATLLRGGTVHVVDGYNADKIITILEQETMQFMFLIPGMIGNFVNVLKQRKIKVKGLALCGAMADLVPLEDIAAASALLNAKYLNSFGATETGLPPATSSLFDIGERPAKLSKRQSAFCELRLVDPEDNDVPNGSPGEAVVRGPTLFSGYWNASVENETCFRNGWFHMGDVLRRNEDGTLDYVDRVKYMIKSGGENIYPAEIEQVLATNPRIIESIVVRKKDVKWGEVPVVFITTNDSTLCSDDILQYCKKHLSRYKQPKEVIFIQHADIPRSTTGKIQRHILEDQLTVN
jgi:acyl-CoA synthetase (AMP-forming)/AMP-acid ligase II